MRNNETGEFELVVGNRQLLSAFFIIVLLFAVAFAMGYVVGENARTAKATDAPVATPPVKTAETRPEPVAAPPAQVPAAEKPADFAPPADTPARPTTQPARDTQAAAPAAAAPASDTALDLAPGAYWQVIATANHDSAVTLVQTLRDKGFPAALSPGPNNLTRVLVGPYADTAEMGRARTGLESAGFNGLRTFRR